MIVMGISLVIFSLRLASGAKTWPARLMMTGSLMLGFGYAVVLPAYEGGLIESIHSPHTVNLEAAIMWHVIRLVTMNAGWLIFGIGVAMHANILPQPAPRKAAAKLQASPHIAGHESAV